MSNVIQPDDVVLDDGLLLADRLIRSLHRNKDGHLAGSPHTHHLAVEPSHNVAILYVYTMDADGGYELHEHYVHSGSPLSYQEWRKIAWRETDDLNEHPAKGYVGVYGWTTAHVPIHPLRNGDLFLTIDINGARGVRLTFGPRQNKRSAHKAR